MIEIIVYTEIKNKGERTMKTIEELAELGYKLKEVS